MMSSCAIADMSGLCNFGGKPKAALEEFWQQCFGRYCLICIHGVVDAKEDKNSSAWCRGCTYLQEFVAFVRENKLGDIVEGAMAENKTMHPGHIVQGVIWAPDYPAIQEYLKPKKPLTL